MYQKLIEEELIKTNNEILESWCFYYLYSAFYFSNVDIVLDLRTLIQDRTITAKGVSESESLQERSVLKSHLGIERPGLPFVSAKLRNNFGSDFNREFGVVFRGTRPQKPNSANNFDCIHSFLTKADLIEHKIVGYTRQPVVFRFPVIWKLKAGVKKILVTTWTIGKVVTYDSDRCSQNRFVVFLRAWETPAVRKHPLQQLACFDV